MEIFIVFGVIVLLFIGPIIIFRMLDKVYDVPKTRIKVITLGNGSKGYFPQVQISELRLWEDIPQDDKVRCYTSEKGAIDAIDKYLGNLLEKIEYIEYP